MSDELHARRDPRTGHAATKISGASLFPLGRELTFIPATPCPRGYGLGCGVAAPGRGPPVSLSVCAACPCPAALPREAGAGCAAPRGSRRLARVRPDRASPGRRAGRPSRGRAGPSRAEPSPLASVPGAEGRLPGARSAALPAASSLRGAPSPVPPRGCPVPSSALPAGLSPGCLRQDPTVPDSARQCRHHPSCCRSPRAKAAPDPAGCSGPCQGPSVQRRRRRALRGLSVCYAVTPKPPKPLTDGHALYKRFIAAYPSPAEAPGGAWLPRGWTPARRLEDAAPGFSFSLSSRNLEEKGRRAAGVPRRLPRTPRLWQAGPSRDLRAL